MSPEKLLFLFSSMMCTLLPPLPGPDQLLPHPGVLYLVSQVGEQQFVPVIVFGAGRVLLKYCK